MAAVSDEPALAMVETPLRLGTGEHFTLLKPSALSYIRKTDATRGVMVFVYDVDDGIALAFLHKQWLTPEGLGVMRDMAASDTQVHDKSGKDADDQGKRIAHVLRVLRSISHAQGRKMAVDAPTGHWRNLDDVFIFTCCEY